jgi:hypothetical protein
MRSQVVKRDHVDKTRESLQTFCRALNGGTVPVDAQTRFGLPGRPDIEGITEILRAMDRDERHRLKHWLDDSLAQGKILPLPAHAPFTPTPSPPPRKSASETWGISWNRW